MSHNLDSQDGKTAFVSANTMGWHQLGQLLENSFTAEQAMEEGYLGGWNVRKVPMFAQVQGKKIQFPGMNAVVRDNPFNEGQVDLLGKYGVSDSYKIIQNEEHAGLLNALVEESGAHFDTAGSLYGGKQVFITMKLPGHINVGGVDPVDNYIAAVNSHDGSMAFTLMVTPVRVMNATTMNLAFAGKSNLFRIRHTSGAEAALHRYAREALDFSFNYLDGFQEQAEQLINATMTQQKFEMIIEREFGAPEGASAAAITRAEKRIDEISELFTEAQTQDGIRNTAWAGLNALTEWADHHSPTRGNDRDNSRAQKSILDPSFKNRALEIMMSHV